MQNKVLYRFIILFISLNISLLSGTSEFCNYDSQTNKVFQNNKVEAAYNGYTLKVNGRELSLDVPPFNINGRLLVPLRAIFEALGGRIDSWDPVTRTAVGSKGNNKIEIQIDNPNAKVNGKNVKLDVPALIIDNRTLVPMRFISENLGSKVSWDPDTRTVLVTAIYGGSFEEIPMGTPEPAPTKKPAITPTPPTASAQGQGMWISLDDKTISIGDDEASVISKLGEPARKDLSEYKFYWYIYNTDYSRYIQVGIKDKRVVALYSNSSSLKAIDGIKLGIQKSEINAHFGTPLTYILKGDTQYMINSNNEYDIYLLKKAYMTVFYDLHDNNQVTAVLEIDKDQEQAKDGFYGYFDEDVRLGYEREIFDLANAIRTRFNLGPYKWDDTAANTVRAHCTDMIKRNFFDHINPDGKSPFDRMEDNGIKYSMAAENIACGQTNAIFAHEGWMNSSGHRKNILGNCEYLGAGVEFGGSYRVYYGQNFYTPFNFN